MIFDAVSAVEAAYDSVSDDESWLRRLAELARPLIAPKHGVVAVLADGRSMIPAQAELLAVTGVDLTQGIVDGLRYMNEFAAKSRDISEQILAAGSVCALSRRLGAHYDEVRPALERCGVGDSLVLFAGEAWGRMCAFSGPRADAVALPREHRALLERFCAHVAAATRLRESGPVSLEDPRIEAIVSTDEVHHARGSAQRRSNLELLRAAARDYERARGRLGRRDPNEALELWRGLVAGRWSLVDVFDSDGRRCVVARENCPRLARRLALTTSELQVVQLAAAGHANKLIAYELGMSAASVAVHIRRAMNKLGVERRADLSRIVMRAPNTNPPPTA